MRVRARDRHGGQRYPALTRGAGLLLSNVYVPDIAIRPPNFLTFVSTLVRALDTPLAFPKSEAFLAFDFEGEISFAMLEFFATRRPFARAV